MIALSYHLADKLRTEVASREKGANKIQLSQPCFSVSFLFDPMVARVPKSAIGLCLIQITLLQQLVMGVLALQVAPGYARQGKRDAPGAIVH